MLHALQACTHQKKIENRKTLSNSFDDIKFHHDILM
jgi:hypothetical protein